MTDTDRAREIARRFVTTAAPDRGPEGRIALAKAFGVIIESYGGKRAEEARAAGKREGIEAAAGKCDEYAAQSRKAEQKAARRANSLGNDPFGHGAMAREGAAECQAAAQEAEALAIAIRALAEPVADDGVVFYGGSQHNESDTAAQEGDPLGDDPWKVLAEDFGIGTAPHDPGHHESLAERWKGNPEYQEALHRHDAPRPWSFGIEMKGFPTGTFQWRVWDWIETCFKGTPAAYEDQGERAARFLEEALELVQAIGMSTDDAHKLVDYVYGRDVGDTAQEVGGVMLTLAALCSTSSLDMTDEGERELARVWTKIDRIRAKQATKPPASPLPGTAPDEAALSAQKHDYDDTFSAFDAVRRAVEIDGDPAPQETGLREWPLPDNRKMVLAWLEGASHHTGDAIGWHREGWAFMWRYTEEENRPYVVHDEWSRDAYDAACKKIDADYASVTWWCYLADIRPAITAWNTRAATPRGLPPAAFLGAAPQSLADADRIIVRLRRRVLELVDAMDKITDCQRARRSGGPDPMDLQELDEALGEAVQIAADALNHTGNGNAAVEAGPAVPGGFSFDGWISNLEWPAELTRESVTTLLSLLHDAIGDEQCGLVEMVAGADNAVAQLRARVAEMEAVVREAFDKITDCERARRSGGPDPMDLQELDEALGEAVQIALDALAVLAGEEGHG